MLAPTTLKSLPPHTRHHAHTPPLPYPTPHTQHERKRADDEEDLVFGLREEIRTLNASTLEAKQEVAQAHEATSLAEEHASECDRIIRR